MSFRSGYVTLLGRPNVGKSTLLNAWVGAKVAIVSPRPQTTRTYLAGVLTREHAQVVVIDTPGIHLPRSRLDRWMMQAVGKGLEGSDLALLVVDATRSPGPEDALAVRSVAEFPGPSLLLLNKIDRIEKTRLLPLIDHYRHQHPFREYLPLSALRGENLSLLEERVIAMLPEGPAYFPPDTLTDQPERFLAAEIVREKVFRETREEVPYATAVVVERYEESAGRVRIQAVLLVEREGQKGILIGAAGERLQSIGRAAREELEASLGRKVYLELWVKTQPDWRERPEARRWVDWREEYAAAGGDSY